MTQTLTVRGMTCENCVRHVRAAIGELPGVRDVEVDLKSGRVTVATEMPLDRTKIAAALEDAGYELA